MKNSGTVAVTLLARESSTSFYYGWVNVVLAALAMTATLPGRTHGLGLITEPLLRDLAIDPVSFARMNFISAIIGASFCIPIGWLIDRVGVRILLAAVTLALGVSVVGMSGVSESKSLLLYLILVRGFGQSALSLVSIAVIAKWFHRGLGAAMGVFAVLLTFGFIGSVLVMGGLIEELKWGAAWCGLGWTITGLAPLFWWLAKDNPAGQLEAGDDLQPNLRNQTVDPIESSAITEEQQWTVRQALQVPAFWVLMLGSSAFNLVWSGVTLFNESIVGERGLDQAASVEIMAILTGVGLLANLVCGGIATRERVLKLLGFGLAFLAIGLAVFPLIDGMFGVRIYALCIGLSGGIITVVFFAGWRHLFGESHLGRIQSVAQLATVLASATGPVLMAIGFRHLDSYRPVFTTLAILVGLISVIAMFVPVPVLNMRDQEVRGPRLTSKKCGRP